ncbi:HNH endonuclease [Aminipila sp.]|uniref:HNH endonuclease n=1 Tax=Aminipila sp. TaxID=2060095 RepID=UPI0028995671|nr:hypothetical protein [Aminipila sp.]
MLLPKPPKKKGRHRQTNACDISPRVRAKVKERDGGNCVICGNNRGIPNCHYIARSHGGLGIEQNIVSACVECHHNYDNGDKREEYGARIRTYLMEHYLDWHEEDLIYKK